MEDCGKNPCDFLFAHSGLSEEAIGGILFVIALIMFLLSYILMVKAIKMIFNSTFTNKYKKYLEKDVPYIPWITSYICLVVGAIITAMVQSSSIITASMVPLVSSQVITLDKAYPITIGSNLGTTVTSMLAALSLKLESHAFQLALCHLFFNFFGIILFFIIPKMRWPLFIARKFGEKAVKYKWFSIFYIVSSFFFLPLMIYGLSLVNALLVYVVSASIFLITLIVVTINYLQEKRPKVLPIILRDWKFLPKPLRTLETVDYIVQTYMEVYCCCIVRRTVAAVPVIGGKFNNKKEDKLFGMNLSGNQDMEMVKIGNSDTKSPIAGFAETIKIKITKP